MTPIYAASGEDVRVLLRQLAELRAALILARKEIVELNSGKRDTELVQVMRQRVREVTQVAERFAVKKDGCVDAGQPNPAGSTSASQTPQDPPGSR